MDPTSLTIRLLQNITNNFSEERALGQGAYGKVYRGMHGDGREIAVKLLHNNMQATDDEPFKREFHNLMMLKHPNIVRLVGYCFETQHQHMEFEGRIVFGETTYKALCFEYMPKGSLQKHLSDEYDGLDWHTHYKIIKGTYENMVPKLANFGLSKLFGEEETRVTQSALGTIGYVPPEYLFGNLVSKKLDIFSLGVVMTKIIAGPRGQTRSAEMPYQEFLDQVQENWRNRLQVTWSSSEPLEAHCHQVKRCAEIALSCMEMDRHRRPSIVDIIHQLNKTEISTDKVAYSEHCQPRPIPSTSCVLRSTAPSDLLEDHAPFGGSDNRGSTVIAPTISVLQSAMIKSLSITNGWRQRPPLPRMLAPPDMTIEAKDVSQPSQKHSGLSSLPRPSSPQKKSTLQLPGATTLPTNHQQSPSNIAKKSSPTSHVPHPPPLPVLSSTSCSASIHCPHPDSMLSTTSTAFSRPAAPSPPPPPPPPPTRRPRDPQDIGAQEFICINKCCSSKKKE